MKKTGIFGCIAVFLGFVSAFVMCVGALRGPKAVASFDETGMRIVLDAGHGGIDGGVTGKSTGVKESDLNLAITLLLKEDLEEMGFEVILTRKTEAGLYGVTEKVSSVGIWKKERKSSKELRPILFYPFIKIYTRRHRCAADRCFIPTGKIRGGSRKGYKAGLTNCTRRKR